MEIELKQTDQGVLLPVQGQPGARRNQIAGVHNGRLKIAVTQIAEKGKANKEIISLIAKSFRISKSQVVLVSGELSSQKLFCLVGLSQSDVENKLAELLSV